MGGTRCTYRNCTARSDGVTHMFHYPVFDKIRCHKWLTNAQRLDFLNLKVSQVRNRVICQHHFKPDNFMNYKMDKLRYDAVPTENGPFCNVNELLDKVKIMPICADEIEDDQLTFKEKVATFSVKYGDFLINSEMDSEKLDIIKKQAETLESLKNTREVEVEFENKPLNIPNQKKKICIISEKKILTPVTVKGKLEPVSSNLIICPRGSAQNAQNGENIENFDVVDLANSEITIYPQSFVDPRNVQINQSTVRLPAVNQNYEPNSGSIQFELTNPEIACSGPELCNKVNETTPLKMKNTQITLQNNQCPPNSLLKSKITPERVAAIEKKRNFNKKLRDMIEFCLDDIPEKTNNENKNTNMKKIQNVACEIDTLKIMEELKKSHSNVSQKPENPTVSSKNNRSEYSNQKVLSFLSEEPSLPSVNEYSMTSLEARLKRMEENLIRKIEQNTQNISELRKTLQSPHQTQRKTAMNVMTQTMPESKEDEDSLKRQLFQEISQFLSPNVNSLIYEELFLNKFSKTPLTPVLSPMKRRKLR